MKKNYSIILGIICHSLRKLKSSEHMPKYPFIDFLDPKGISHLTPPHYHIPKIYVISMIP